jgi:hypothetical protein
MTPRAHAPLSGVERLAWHAAGWLLTAACGALTVSGFLGARAGAPAASPPRATAAAPERPAVSLPAHRPHCARSIDG